jgi:hypothetical protein
MTNKLIIYTNSSGGVAVGMPTDKVSITEFAAQLKLTDYEIIEREALPEDRLFRDAWVKTGATVVEDLAKSKVIAHEMRRAKRAEEFSPYDDLISKQIPGSDTDAAEALRAAIRVKYETLQSDIDAATTVAEIKTALG